jgi:short-subunit dehydrogenase
VLDLGKAADPAADLLKFVGDRPLAVLANNAGFGNSHNLADADPAILAAMIHLNITVLTLVTRAFVPKLVAQGSGRILQVASTAAFSPIPTMAVYGATKAYVLSFSAALSQELKGTGVTVTALCPGATATRFAERAAFASTGFFQGAMSPVVVARQGVDALLKGRRTRVNGLSNQLMALSTRLAPRSLAAAIAQSMMKE